ncbi:MAG: M20 family peptidase, partial [Clostridium sp.]|nr:M20 family peptidase [Clostridium sp.]
HINPPKNVNAGLSIGAISNYVPTIHPYISIIDNTMIKYGTRDFADYTQSSFAFSQLQKSALALAYTGSDLILKPSLLNEVKNYFYSN